MTMELPGSPFSEIDFDVELRPVTADQLDALRGAVVSGDPGAMVVLAMAMLSGDCVDRDQDEALVLLERAAALGEPTARRLAARVHLELDPEGEGPREARRWLLRAQAAGDADSLYRWSHVRGIAFEDEAGDDGSRTSLLLDAARLGSASARRELADQLRRSEDCRLLPSDAQEAVALIAEPWRAVTEHVDVDAAHASIRNAADHVPALASLLRALVRKRDINHASIQLQIATFGSPSLLLRNGRWTAIVDLRTQLVGDDPVAIDARELADRWALDHWWDEENLEQLAGAAWRHGWRVEPDVRIGSPMPREGETFVFSRRAEDEPLHGSALFHIARTWLRLALHVAWSDEELADAERKLLVELVGRMSSLRSHERARLLSVADLAMPVLFDQGDLIAIASAPPRVQRDMISFVIGLAAADSALDEGEARTLEELHHSLGLDIGELRTELGARVELDELQVEETFRALRSSMSSDVPPPAVPMDVVEEEEDVERRTIDNLYELREPFGEAVVDDPMYRAHNPYKKGRKLAIRLFRSDVDVARHKDEVNALKKLVTSHFIVPRVDAGEDTQNGFLYVVYDVAGLTPVREFIDSDGDPESATRFVLTGVLEALEDIHEYGVTHASLHLDAVFLDQEARVRLARFDPRPERARDLAWVEPVADESSVEADLRRAGLLALALLGLDVELARPERIEELRSALAGLDSSFREVLLSLLRQSPALRITCREALARLGAPISEPAADSGPNVAAAPGPTFEDPSFEPDPSQREVIEQPSASTQFVEAPPGAGKTAVACARVAHLVRSHGIDPGRVLFLGFARTTVAELRARIERMLGADVDGVSSIQVLSIDQFAWRIHRVADIAPNATGYDANIQSAISLLEENKTAREWIRAELTHVLIDEAQDIVGIRRRFVTKILGLRGADAGSTIFGDPKQAIYGWTSDDTETPGLAGGTLVELLAELGFRHRMLGEQHRMAEPRMGWFFEDLRELAAAGGDRNSYVDMWDRTRDRATATFGDAPSPGELGSWLGDRDERRVFLLSRFRSVALAQSAALDAAGIGHAVRLRSVRPVIHPWIGRALSVTSGSILRRGDFRELWEDRVAGNALAAGWDRDAAWELLRLAAPGDGDQKVDLDRLRMVLRGNPQPELTRAEVGHWGRRRIVSTIHASKGREADEVVLYSTVRTSRKVPPNDRSWDEEHRVLYVAATRAAHALRIGKGPTCYGQEVNGRMIEERKKSWKASPWGIRAEFGTHGDVDPVSTVIGPTSPNSEEADRLQDALVELMSAPVPPEARWERIMPGGAARLIVEDPSAEDGVRLVGRVAHATMSDLDWVSRRVSWRGPLMSQRGLRLVDLTTVTLDPDVPADRMPVGDFGSSGFWLAPVIRGFTNLEYER